MLLIIVGAGASYDSIPSRIPPTHDFEKFRGLEKYRPPLADELFESRDLFEQYQRAVPQVLQIAAELSMRTGDESVEDILASYADDAPRYTQRRAQLAAVRFYIQAIINACEHDWYRQNQVATNLMRLIDSAESFRLASDQPLFVTFNYDRLIENALENRGQSFSSMSHYVLSSGIPLFKLHGSVDWMRRIESVDASKAGFVGNQWQIAQKICDQIATLPSPGNIELTSAVPSSLVDGNPALPAIAIPLKEKSTFECPPEHINALCAALPQVKTVLTIGWRGAEHHFLQMLRRYISNKLDVICVDKGAAQVTIDNMRSVGLSGQYEPYQNGFTNFVAERRAERLFRITWPK